MGCVQSSNPAQASTPPNTPTKQYVSQISAQSTLNTATSRKSTRRDTLTGWTIDSIEEYYEPIANDEKMEKFGKAAELGTGNFGTVYKTRNRQKGYECALKKILCATNHNSNSMESLKEVTCKSDASPGIIRIYEVMETKRTYTYHKKCVLAASYSMQ